MTKKEALVHLAFKEILNSETGDISLNEIIKKSGVAKGTFYHYFKNKDELIKSIVEEYLIGYFSKIQLALQDESKTPLDKLNTIFERIGEIEELLKEVKPSKDRMRAYFALFARVLHKYEYLHKDHIDGRQQFFSSILQIVKDGQQDGSFTTAYSAEKLTNFMVALVQGTFAMGIHDKCYSLKDSQVFIIHTLQNTKKENEIEFTGN